MTDYKCIECRQPVKRAISREQGPFGPERRMVWCSNPQCSRYGEMIEDETPAEGSPVVESRRVTGN